jgi:TolA-binding protein
MALALVAIALFGCAAMPRSNDPAEAEFQAAAALLKKERFADAIRGFQAVADRHPKHARAPDALYAAGSARLHPRNAAADPDAALRDFQRLVRAYPTAPRRDEAQTWVAVLTQLGGLRTEVEKLRSDLQRLLDLDVESEKKRREMR